MSRTDRSPLSRRAVLAAGSATFVGCAVMPRGPAATETLLPQSARRPCEHEFCRYFVAHGVEGAPGWCRLGLPEGIG